MSLSSEKATAKADDEGNVPSIQPNASGEEARSTRVGDSLAAVGSAAANEITAAAGKEDRMVTTELRPTDVLTGRGAFINGYVGNVAYRRIIRSRKTEYMEAFSQRVKHAIAIGVIRQVEQSNGRFLEKIEPLDDDNSQENDGANSVTSWYVFPTNDPVIIEKVKQALRERDQSASKGAPSHSNSNPSHLHLNQADVAQPEISSPTGLAPLADSHNGRRLVPGGDYGAPVYEAVHPTVQLAGLDHGEQLSSTLSLPHLGGAGMQQMMSDLITNRLSSQIAASSSLLSHSNLDAMPPMLLRLEQQQQRSALFGSTPIAPQLGPLLSNAQLAALIDARSQLLLSLPPAPTAQQLLSDYRSTAQYAIANSLWGAIADADRASQHNHLAMLRQGPPVVSNYTSLPFGAMTTDAAFPSTPSMTAAGIPRQTIFSSPPQHLGPSLQFLQTNPVNEATSPLLSLYPMHGNDTSNEASLLHTSAASLRPSVLPTVGLTTLPPGLTFGTAEALRHPSTAMERTAPVAMALTTSRLHTDSDSDRGRHNQARKRRRSS